MDGDDIENLVTGKELRQRYVGSGDGSSSDQKISSSKSQGDEKGKNGPNIKKEMLMIASIAIVAVLTITLLLIFVIHSLKSSLS